MGLVQHDGSTVQAGITQFGVVMRYNWILDTAKLALRIDSGEDGRYGLNGTMFRNVVVNALESAAQTALDTARSSQVKSQTSAIPPVGTDFFCFFSFACFFLLP